MHAMYKWVVVIAFAYVCINASEIVLEEISDALVLPSAKSNQTAKPELTDDNYMLEVHALVDDPFIASKYNQTGENLSDADWNSREAYLSAVIQVSRYIAIPPLIFVSAIFSGLTLGLLSLNKVGLKVLIAAGNQPNATIKEQQNATAASRILSIRKNGHRLLTTLVLGNISTNSLLSILIADMTNGLIGFLISTCVILLFGEIVPQAVCARHAISLGSKLVPVVEALLILFHPVAKSAQTALDHFIGEESGRIYSKKELAKYLEIHANQSVLSPQEIALVRMTLRYKKLPVNKVMVRLENTSMISICARLDYQTMSDLHQHGQDWIPVWHNEPDEVIGFFFLNDLTLVHPNEHILVSEFMKTFGHPVRFVMSDASVEDVMKIFQQETQLVLIHDALQADKSVQKANLHGFVTLDIITNQLLSHTIL